MADPSRGGDIVKVPSSVVVKANNEAFNEYRKAGGPTIVVKVADEEGRLWRFEYDRNGPMGAPLGDPVIRCENMRGAREGMRNPSRKRSR